MNKPAVQRTNESPWRIFQNLFDAVAIFNRDLKLVYGNTRLRKLSRLPSGVFDNLPLIYEILHLQQKEIWKDVVSGRLQCDSESQALSMSFSFSSGTKGFAQIFFDKISAPDASETLYLCVFRDITFEIQSRSIMSENEKLITELKRNHSEAHFLWRLALETPIYLEPPQVLTAVAKKLKEDLGFADASFLRIVDTGEEFKYEAMIQDQRIGSRLREVAKLIGKLPGGNQSRMDVSSMEVPPYGKFWITRFRPKLEEPFILLARSEPSEAETNRRNFLEPLAIQIIEWLDNRSIYISSITDGLTELFNRRHFDSRLAIECILARERNMALSVLMLDIDNFKDVNDTYGHQAGDEVLKALGQILKTAVRATDIPARLGGEEFAILLVDTSAEDAMVVAEKIRSRFEQTTTDVPLTGQQIRATISIGVAGYQGTGDTPEAVMKAADTALYKAKNSGRNQVVLSLSHRS